MRYETLHVRLRCQRTTILNYPAFIWSMGVFKAQNAFKVQLIKIALKGHYVRVFVQGHKQIFTALRLTKESYLQREYGAKRCHQYPWGLSSQEFISTNHIVQVFNFTLKIGQNLYLGPKIIQVRSYPYSTKGLPVFAAKLPYFGQFNISVFSRSILNQKMVIHCLVCCFL